VLLDVDEFILPITVFIMLFIAIEAELSLTCRPNDNFSAKAQLIA